ncbi:MAG: hypothetical protein ACI9DC_000822 [Gammaproteobacteria bacterium]|jgi:hypothetical protein
MTFFEFAYVAILLRFGLMALSALRSDSATDYLSFGCDAAGRA